MDNDPKEIVKDVSSVGHWGNGDYEMVMQTDEEMKYIFSLIKQSLKENKNNDGLIVHVTYGGVCAEFELCVFK